MEITEILHNILIEKQKIELGKLISKKMEFSQLRKLCNEANKYLNNKFVTSGTDEELFESIKKFEKEV